MNSPKDHEDVKNNDLYTISLPDSVKKPDGGEGQNQKADERSVDFERAITLAGYGKFNYLLLLAIVPAGWASVYNSTVMSYVLPSAECDLELTMFDKGLLNSMVFAGMISSSFIWGLTTDTFGRKNTLFYGYLCDGIFNVASIFSRASWILILFKFLSGVIISGPFASLMSYLAEIHGEEHRSRTYMWLGVFFSLGNISVPCIAWLIIPQDWQLNIFDGFVVLNSWRIFLAISSIPSFAACLAISFFPESPRFLISKCRLQEALEVFKKIYAMNTGKHPDTYPVKSLAEETSMEASGKSFVHMMRCGWRQTKPLFAAPNISKLILISSIQFGATLGSNSLRLWMPQLFAMIETYQSMHPLESSGSYPSVCYMLDKTNYRPQSNITIGSTNNPNTCTEMVLDSTVYINSMVIALTGVIGYTMAGTLINAVGKKKLMVFCFALAGSCCGILYWAEDSNGILGLSSVFVAMASIGGATVVNVIVDNFPTYLRTMAVSVTMVIGRFGAVIGNLLFPILLNIGCLGPFIMIGSACLACALLVLFLPTHSSSTKKAVSDEGTEKK
ncbi:synaptic vesicle glycoprotein 2B isoform X2 [Cephus cinctus]|uniref:Synaptic vesicle glycoprotein 2B isoform X2 n=1 Tax=Cephus cinctus TaxID=211228 RepID=A0AAJ7RM29_CEPCN|nr:synaptic vesicle glycoprotein 2B isoform X2 [Cephus cinctus]